MIGILAGMGPKSTAPFVDKVVAQCQQIYGAKYDIDFPPMLIYSCPTPFFFDRPVDHAVLAGSIVAGAERLAGMGVDFIAIPCNIAHIYLADIRAAVSVPVIDMVGEALAQLPKRARRIAVFATAGTMDSKLYERGLAAANLEQVWQESWQTEITALIGEIKTNGASPKAQEQWKFLSEAAAKEADALVIACTDLNVVADLLPPPLPVTDTSLTLAQAIVRNYLRLLR